MAALAGAHEDTQTEQRTVARRMTRGAAGTRSPRRRLTAVPGPGPIGPVEVQILDNPKGDDRLRFFTCGRTGDAAVAEVNWAARMLSRGLLLGQIPTVVVTLTKTAGELIGWAGVQRRHLCEVHSPLPPGAYIVAIGTTWRYQGRRLDDGRRPGDALMAGTLDKIATLFDDYPSSYTWARVLPDNAKSLRLFTDHDFEHFPRPHLPEGDVCARPTLAGR
jgi:hypothetical protein